MSDPTIRQKVVFYTRAVLVFIGILGLGLGYAYLGGLPSTGARGPRLLDALFPIHGWAILWMVAGLVSIAAAVKVKPIGASLVVGMLCVWGASSLVSWLVNGQEAHRDWLGALVYFATGLLLWCSVGLAAIALEATTRLGP